MAVEPGPVTDVRRRLLAVRARIDAACARSGRAPEEVELVAVSKRHGVDAIREAYDAGVRVFGENYVQELVEKAELLKDLMQRGREPLRFRFVGHLQRNKVGPLLRTGATLDSLDSVRLAEALSRRAHTEEREVDVLVQVNLAGEEQKSGCAEEDVPRVVEAARALPNLHLRGLMLVPPASIDAAPFFARLRHLAEALELPELSMGMSSDFEQAIAQGATSVRIGTAIFGSRQ